LYAGANAVEKIASLDFFRESPSISVVCCFREVRWITAGSSGSKNPYFDTEIEEG